MLTSTYQFCSTKTRGGRKTTRSAVKPNVAIVYGTIRSVPFMLYFKSMAAAEKLRDATFGSKLVPL
jgi:hypothetical protein